MVVSLLLLISNVSKGIAEDSDTIWTHSFIGSGYVSNALFSPDDKSIYVTTTERFYELETETGKIIREIPEIRGAKYFSKDGRYAYTYDLKKVDMITKETKGSFVNPLLPWYYYDFDVCDTAKIYVGIIKHSKQFPLPDSTIGIFDSETFEVKKIIQLLNNYMEKIAISPDGRFIATNSLYDPDPKIETDNTLITTIWDSKTYQKITQVQKGGSTLLKFSPDGKYLGVGGGNYVFQYDTETWNLVGTFNFDPPADISSFTFSNDSKYIYLAGYNRSINVFEIENNKLFKTIGPKWLSNVLNISHNNLYIAGLGGYYTMLWKNTLTGTIDYNKINKITIAPNPIKDTMVINGFEQPVQNISIYNLKGNLVYTKSDFLVNSETIRINLSFLTYGTYILKVKTSNNEFSSKFVKE
jgi:WD40 repeat protein